MDGLHRGRATDACDCLHHDVHLCLFFYRGHLLHNYEPALQGC